VSETDEPRDDLVLDYEVVLGFPANATRVLRGRDEFMVDFLRHVPERSRPFLVARALVMPIVAIELRDQLDDAWRSYSEWSMPEDLHG
jgi:hypothetical protein